VWVATLPVGRFSWPSRLGPAASERSGGCFPIAGAESSDARTGSRFPTSAAQGVNGDKLRGAKSIATKVRPSCRRRVAD
jgi:hypothetical protein